MFPPILRCLCPGSVPLTLVYYCVAFFCVDDVAPTEEAAGDPEPSAPEADTEPVLDGEQGADEETEQTAEVGRRSIWIVCILYSSQPSPTRGFRSSETSVTLALTQLIYNSRSWQLPVLLSSSKSLYLLLLQLFNFSHQITLNSITFFGDFVFRTIS